MTTALRARRRNDRGAVTAEIAVGLPAVVVVLAACLGGLGLATSQLRAHDTAADAARLLGRGEPVAAVEQLIARSLGAADLVITRPAGLVCATVVVEQRVMLIPLHVSGASCALADGR